MRLILTVALVLVFVSCNNIPPHDTGVASMSAENTQDCDNHAAHPDDVMRFAPGKAEGEVVGVLALRACSEAVKRFPREARFRFQLGRALAALRREGEAAKEFETAASMGYGPAKFYRAQALLASYFESGPEAEYEQAVRLLEEVKESFAPAAKRYDEVVYSSEGFQNPRIIDALYAGDVERLNRARILVAFYVSGMQEFFSIDLHPVGNECPAIMVESSINLDLDAAVVGDPKSTPERWAYDLMFLGAEWAGKIFIDPVYRGDPAKWREYYKTLGRRDGYHLANKFGCESPVSKKVYNGVVKFARAKRPLAEYMEELSKGRGRDLFLVASEEPAAEEAEEAEEPSGDPH